MPTELPKTVGNYDSFNPAGEKGQDITITLPEDANKEEVKIEDFKNLIKQQSGVEPTLDVKKADDKKTEPVKDAADEKDKKPDDKVVTTDDKTIKDKGAPDTTSGIKPLELPAGTTKSDNVQDEDVKTYGEAAVGLFKKMSKEAVEFVKARLKENGELKNESTELKKTLAKPTVSYLDHEQGYVLTPEFQKAINTKNQVTGELNFWREQFAKIRAGEPWQDLVIDGNNKLVTVERKPDANSEATVLGYLNQGQFLLHQQDGEIAKLSGSFKGAYTNRVNEIKSLEDNIFPLFKDPKENEKNTHIQQVNKLLKDKGLENNILAGFISKLYAFSMQQSDYIKDKELEWSKQQKLEENKVKAGPTSGDINNTSGNKISDPDKEVVDFSAFDKIKRGF